MTEAHAVPAAPSPATPAPAARPRASALIPLLCAVVALECALALAGTACEERVREAARYGTLPAWLTAGAPPERAADTAFETAAYALTCLARILQTALVFVWVRRTRLDPPAGLRLGGSARAAGVALGFLGLVALGAAGLELAFRLLFDSGFVLPVLLGGGPDPAYGAWPHFTVALAAQGVCGPVAEEAICRGLVYAPLRDRLGIPRAVVLSAMVFAAIHRNFDPIPFTMIATGGVLFAAAYQAGRGLAAPILFHAAYNGLVVALRHPGWWA